MQEIMLSEIYRVPEEQLGAMAHLGIRKALVAEEQFSVVMDVEDIHMNMQGTVHGGVLYALCDQAVGAYVAYKGLKGVGMDGTIHYYRPANKGDTLTATVSERKIGKTVGVYFVELKNQKDQLIADSLFTTMYMH